MNGMICVYCNGHIPQGWPVRWWTELQANGEELLVTAHKFKTECAQEREIEANFLREVGITL